MCFSQREASTDHDGTRRPATATARWFAGKVLLARRLLSPCVSRAREESKLPTAKVMCVHCAEWERSGTNVMRESYVMMGGGGGEVSLTIRPSPTSSEGSANTGQGACKWPIRPLHRLGRQASPGLLRTLCFWSENDEHSVDCLKMDRCQCRARHPITRCGS